MRLIPLALWLAITITYLLIVLSDWLFGAVPGRLVLQRLGLALIWPLAVLSRPGRNILFNVGKKL